MAHADLIPVPFPSLNYQPAGIFLIATFCSFILTLDYVTNEEEPENPIAVDFAVSSILSLLAWLVS